MFLKEYKYIEKKKVIRIRYIADDLKVSSDNPDESDEE